MPGAAPKNTKAGKKAAPTGKGAKNAKNAKNAKKATPKKVENTTPFQPTTRNFGVGQAVQHKRDLSRFTRYPLYVQRQRKVAILKRRLKVPPAVNQFLDKNQVLGGSTKKDLIKLLSHYKPETAKERTERRKKAADDVKNSKKVEAPAAPLAVTYGIQEVTKAVEKKHAKLVVIASDVEPLEVVIWLPALCKAQGVPYAIVNGKSTLGQLVHGKTCSAVAVTNVKAQDRDSLEKLIHSINSQFADRFDELKKQWGGQRLGDRTVAMLKKRAEKVKAQLKK